MQTGSREYQAWQNAKGRCFRKTDDNYHNYGGRGITMSREWASSFERFYADMGECPPGLTLERKNVNGNYEKDNCKWADMQEQANNRRDNVIVNFNGQSMTFAELSRITGIQRDKLSYRLKHYPEEIALDPNIDLRAGRKCKFTKRKWAPRKRKKKDGTYVVREAAKQEKQDDANRREER